MPDGWEADEAPECLGIFVDPAATGFRVNVVVNADRVPADFDLEDAAASTLEQCTDVFDDFRVEQEQAEVIGGEPAALRFQSFALEGLEDRIMQLQVLLFAPPGGRVKTRDLFHIDGSCLAADAQTYAPVFVAAALSFRFT